MKRPLLERILLKLFPRTLDDLGSEWMDNKIREIIEDDALIGYDMPDGKFYVAEFKDSEEGK